MSKIIDFSQPLSAEDAAYVADRPWLQRDAELAGIEVQFEDDEFYVDSDEDDEGGESPEGEDGSDEDTDSGDDGDDESEEDEEDEGDGLEELDFTDLKEAAGSRGLSKAGSKEQLIARIREHDAETEEDESDDESDDDSAE